MGELEERKAQSREFSLARAVIYRLFSRCFSYPDRELLDLFGSARAGEYLDSWRCLGFNASEGIAEVTGWLKEFPTHQAALDELEKEYTRLFVNAYPHVLAPPYSSVYLDKHGKVWGQSTAQAARLYEAAGLSIAQDFYDIPDHIAAEL
jgi:TorA maturation chaperone TorD